MRYRLVCALTIIICLIIIGLHYNGVALFEYSGKEEGIFLIEITSDYKEKNYYNVYEGKIENKDFLIYIKKDEEIFNIGDKLNVDAVYDRPSKARNDGGFDYSLYLKTKKIYGSFKVNEILKVKRNQNVNILNNVRKYIKTNLRNNLKKENAELAIALLLGDKSNLSDDIQEDFRNANLTHLLAISGAHFSYIILIVNFITKKFKRKRVSQIILIVSIIFFMNLTNNTPSVVRAGIMSIMIVLASVFKRKNHFYTSLCLSLLIQILNNPYVIFDLGLILSYSGVIGIVKFYDFFHNKIKNKLISVTLSANVLIIPIMIYNFNTISFTFLISNVLASGLLGMIIIIEFISIIFNFKLFFFLLDVSLSIISKIAYFCSKLPFSKVFVTTNSIFFVLLIYLIIFILFKKRIKFLPIILCAILILNFSFKFNYNIDELKIEFIDVGQGDSTLLINKGSNLLIDTGGLLDSSYDIGENVLIKFLLYKGIDKINYLMISHFDADHCQGSIFLLNNLKIENLIISKQPENSKLYEEIITICKKKNIKILYVKNGDKLNIKNLKIEILHPSEDFILENPLNNNAIVCKITYYNFKMLFTGDIEKIAEEKILTNFENTDILESDLLKVGHHGSKTSSTQTFLEKVKPKIALIGVGENNKFGHPNNDVIERLENLKVNIFRTDKMGRIQIKVNKNGKIKIDTFLKK